jgi:hypothetical protein
MQKHKTVEKIDWLHLGTLGTRGGEVEATLPVSLGLGASGP